MSISGTAFRNSTMLSPSPVVSSLPYHRSWTISLAWAHRLISCGGSNVSARSSFSRMGSPAVRIAGKRVFGKWAALDIIVSIMAGSNLSRALTGNAPLGGTLAATSLLMGLHYCSLKQSHVTRSRRVCLKEQWSNWQGAVYKKYP